MITDVKKKLIREIVDADEETHTTMVLSILKDFTCVFCGVGKPYKRVFTDPGLGDLCGRHAQIVDKFREIGLSNEEMLEYMPQMEALFPNRYVN